MHTTHETPCGSLDVIGDPRLLEPGVRRLAVVGSRASTQYGEHVAWEIVRGLAPDVVVVSGGAYGIDITAHRAALETGHRTIVVLPCGIGNAYPRVHADVFQRVVATGGAVVSEFEPHVAASRTRFLERNRTIACMSAGMVVVEADVRSGSMQAARQAIALGRPLMAVPGPVTSATSTGTHHLIRSGDARLVTSASDVHQQVTNW